MTVVTSACLQESHRHLEQLGVGDAEIKKYTQLFCSTRRSDRYLQKTDRSWVTRKCPWEENLIVSHLLGEIIIGLFPADDIDYLMLDIDNRDRKQSTTPQERCKRILPVFEPTPLVYTSSESGGLRVCYFLDAQYPKGTVYRFAEHRLRQSGVIVKPSFLEIMATNRGDRLPFGLGCTLVDPMTLMPIVRPPLADMIQQAWDIRSGKRLRIDGAGGELAEDQIPRPKFNDIVADLLENGLPPNEVMTTNEALLKLTWELMGRRGHGKEETRRALRSWINTRHNGNSIRINAGRIEEVCAQIDRIVDGFDQGKVKFSGLVACPTECRLTVRDVEVILQLFEAYRDQLAAFSLLEYTKRHGELLDTISATEKQNSAISYFTSNYNVTGFVHVWVCSIPYKAFVKFPGFNRTNPRVTRRSMERSGLMEFHEREDMASHLCRKYKIYFNFDQDGAAVVSLDDALLRLKTKQQLKASYGKRRTASILKEGGEKNGRN
jgi:hypothetical protein